MDAIECFGQDAGGRCFADSARAGKQVGVSDAAGHDGAGQCPRDLFLPDQLVEGLGAIAAGDDQVFAPPRVDSGSIRPAGTRGVAI